MQIWVVEDDEVERLGQAAALLSADPELDVQSCSTSEAERLVDGGELPLTGSVVLMGIRPTGDDFDRYPSVAALRRLRLVADHGCRMVGIHRQPCNPLVAMRLARAGLSAMVDSTAARSGRQLLELINGGAGGCWARDLEPTSRGLAQLGVRESTDPDGAIDYVTANGYQAAFTPGTGQTETGLSRRAIMRARRDIGEIAGLVPDVHRATGGMWRPSQLPTWRSVVGYVNLARGLQPIEAGAADGALALSGL